MEKYKIEPRHIYNMDEKGFLIGILGKQKRVFSKQVYEASGLRSIMQDGNREWIMLLACICADGTAIDPALIYQSASGRIQDMWLEAFDTQKDRGFFSFSPSGWTSDQLGYQWLVQAFDRQTKNKARRSWRLLEADGHGFHLTMRVLDFCDANRILLAVFPPHSTHALQPLDVSLFGSLANAYSQQLTFFINEAQGLTSITKRDFFTLFDKAWRTTFIPQSRGLAANSDASPRAGGVPNGIPAVGGKMKRAKGARGDLSLPGSPFSP
jgi:uncharacterized protein YndB with AHSA1/START domain